MTDLPPGWAWTTLGDVAELGSGGTPRSGDARFYSGDIPWAVIGDLRDSTIAETRSTITQAGLTNSSAKLVPPGAVLLAMYGSIGKLGMVARQMATNQAIAFAIPTKALIDGKFLFWYLRSQRSLLTSKGKGATQQNISQTLLRTWPVPLPTPTEQQRIVETLEAHLSLLDSATSTLQTTSVRLATLGRAASAQLWEQSATTGMSIAVGSLGRVITGSTPSRTLAEAFGGEVPFVTPSDVGRGGEVVTTARTLSQRGAAATRVLTPGSIVTVCIGATLGKVGWSKSAVATNQQINGIELDALAARPDFVAVLMVDFRSFRRRRRAGRVEPR